MNTDEHGFQRAGERTRFSGWLSLVFIIAGVSYQSLRLQLPVSTWYPLYFH